MAVGISLLVFTARILARTHDAMAEKFDKVQCYTTDSFFAQNSCHPRHTQVFMAHIPSQKPEPLRAHHGVDGFCGLSSVTQLTKKCASNIEPKRRKRD